VEIIIFRIWNATHFEYEQSAVDPAYVAYKFEGMKYYHVLVVEPTHLKNMSVKLGSSSPKKGVKMKKIFELPPSTVPLLYGDYNQALKGFRHSSIIQ